MKRLGRPRLAALAGMFLAALLFTGALQTQAADFRAKGIDVSRWQGRINWASVKKDGVEFVMLGLGRLRGNKAEPDPNFKYNINGAINQNIKVGVYLYSLATTEAQARAEARYVLNQIKGYRISYPVAFDIEDKAQMALSNKRRTDITIAFLEVIAQAGYHPMIYASENWLKNSMDLSRLTKYDKWVARWGSAPSLSPMSMWQYSSTGRVSGIPANVDLNYCYKDYSKIITPQYGPVNGKTGWQTEDGQYWYVEEDGLIAVDGFKKIDGELYYFDSNGYRASGWTQIGKGRYYFYPDSGILARGWFERGGKRFYLDRRTGVLATGWNKIDGELYYMNGNGIVQTGWLAYRGKYYYLDRKDGHMCRGWLKIGTYQFFLQADGTRASGLKKIGTWWYSFSTRNGSLQKNCKVGNLYAGSDGILTVRKP